MLPWAIRCVNYRLKTIYKLKLKAKLVYNRIRYSFTVLSV